MTTVQRQLLIALFPTEEVRAGIEAHRKNWLWPAGCSFPPKERLHLTLQHLDDQQGDAERRLLAALAEVPAQPLQLALDRCGTWSNDVAVIQPSEHEDLRALQHDISHVLLRAGFSLHVPVRGWTPHITIARKAEHAASPAVPQPIRWTATEFRLVRSHFTSPFRHELLGSYPLH